MDLDDFISVFIMRVILVCMLGILVCSIIWEPVANIFKTNTYQIIASASAPIAILVALALGVRAEVVQKNVEERKQQNINNKVVTAIFQELQLMLNRSELLKQTIDALKGEKVNFKLNRDDAYIFTRPFWEASKNRVIEVDKDIASKILKCEVSFELAHHRFNKESANGKLSPDEMISVIEKYQQYLIRYISEISIYNMTGKISETQIRAKTSKYVKKFMNETNQV